MSHLLDLHFYSADLSFYFPSILLLLLFRLAFILFSYFLSVFCSLLPDLVKIKSNTRERFEESIHWRCKVQKLWKNRIISVAFIKGPWNYTNDWKINIYIKTTTYTYIVGMNIYVHILLMGDSEFRMHLAHFTSFEI